MFRYLTLFLAFLIGFKTLPMFAADLSPGEQLLKKIEGFRAENSSSVLVDLSIKDFKDDKLITEFGYQVMYQNHDKSLLKQVFPKAREGNLILIIGSDMWFRSKDSSRPMRITPQQKLLGGASNADVAKFGFYHDYTATIVADSAAEAQGLIVLELIAKSKESAYAKIQLFVQKKDEILKTGDFYGTSGQKIKSVTYSDPKSFDGLPARPAVLTIRDQLFNKNSYTVIEYKAIKKDQFPAKYFNFNYLKSYHAP